MLAAQSELLALTNSAKLWGKSNRRPLQPKNSNAPATAQSFDSQFHSDNEIKMPRRKWIDISPFPDDSNKENHPNLMYMVTTPTKLKNIDSSLAEELSAVKKKLERLRLDRERTEKMLDERDMILVKMKKEIEQRGEVQRQMEMEVDRLYRMKQLRFRCMRVLPIQSLREKEQGKTTNGIQSEMNSEKVGMEGWEDEVESEMQSPGSATSQIVADKS